MAEGSRFHFLEVVSGGESTNGDFVAIRNLGVIEMSGLRVILNSGLLRLKKS